MIVKSSHQFQEVYSVPQFPADSPATAKGVFMITPNDFYLADESSLDNAYMDLASAVDPQRALAQHQELALLISKLGIPVISFPGYPGRPDNLFPNNVFATVSGKLIIGSMRHSIRQIEADRADIVNYFERIQGYSVVDLRKQSGIGELTGVLAIDRARQIAYCGMTERVNDAGCAAMQRAFEFKLIYCCQLKPREYHINVVLSLLASRACVIHLGSFCDPQDAQAIASVYAPHVLYLSDDEKACFAGNCISLTETDLFMSDSAFQSLRPASLAWFEEQQFTLHHTQLDEIEKSGGSLRCLLAEFF